MGQFGDGRFDDRLSINIVASKFLNLPTVSTLHNCSRKTFPVGIHGQDGREKLSEVNGKSLHCFLLKYVSWSLPVSNLWHPAPPNASSLSPS